MNGTRKTLVDDLLLGVTGLVMLAALAAVFIFVPADADQGDVQRIFYVHLSMWLPTFTAFAIVGVASMLYLWKREARYDRLAFSSAEIGLLFCTLGLATGSIWAKPIWGVWWTWDARLTLTFILWMIYAAYLLLRTLSNSADQGATLSAVLGVTGVADLYLVYKAVHWWGGIHPAVIQTRQGGTGLNDPAMRFTLILCLLAFFLLFFCLLRLRLRQARLQETADDLRDTLARI